MVALLLGILLAPARIRDHRGGRAERLVLSALLLQNLDLASAVSRLLLERFLLLCGGLACLAQRLQALEYFLLTLLADFGAAVDALVIVGLRGDLLVDVLYPRRGGLGLACIGGVLLLQIADAVLKLSVAPRSFALLVFGGVAILEQLALVGVGLAGQLDRAADARRLVGKSGLAAFLELAQRLSFRKKPELVFQPVIKPALRLDQPVGRLRRGIILAGHPRPCRGIADLVHLLLKRRKTLNEQVDALKRQVENSERPHQAADRRPHRGDWRQHPAEKSISLLGRLADPAHRRGCLFGRGRGTAGVAIDPDGCFVVFVH